MTKETTMSDEETLELEAINRTIEAVLAVPGRLHDLMGEN